MRFLEKKNEGKNRHPDNIITLPAGRLKYVLSYLEVQILAGCRFPRSTFWPYRRQKSTSDQVEIIVAPGDSSRRVWNVRNVQGNLKRHVRVYHVQNLKSVKSRRRVKISPVHRLWSHHRMPVAIRTCWTSFQTPKYTPPGSNFDRTEAFFLLSSR